MFSPTRSMWLIPCSRLWLGVAVGPDAVIGRLEGFEWWFKIVRKEVLVILVVSGSGRKAGNVAGTERWLQVAAATLRVGDWGGGDRRLLCSVPVLARAVVWSFAPLPRPGCFECLFTFSQ